MAAVMGALKAGVLAGDVHAAWQAVLDRYGLEKPSRIGYSIGAGYAPDWASTPCPFAPARRLVPEDAVVHVILGMWMDDWGMESARRSMSAETTVSACAISRSMFTLFRHDSRRASAT